LDRLAIGLVQAALLGVREAQQSAVLFLAHHVGSTSHGTHITRDSLLVEIITIWSLLCAHVSDPRFERVSYSYLFIQHAQRHHLLQYGIYINIGFEFLTRFQYLSLVRLVSFEKSVAISTCSLRNSTYKVTISRL
jgi:hypothetical protein